MRYSILVLLCAGLLLFACSKQKPRETGEMKQDDAAMQAGQDEQAMEMNANMEMPDLNTLTWMDGPEGMKYAVISEGMGTDIQNGDRPQVHYTGWVKDDGKMFDSSRKRGTPFVFTVGQGQVIKGWDLGVDMMKVGGHWIFLLPPELAYGEHGAGGVIPPNATLVFDVEVMGLEPKQG